jgi:hypothetical protein
MNGLCSACGQPVELVDFRLDEGRVLVRCPACGKEQRLSLSDAGGAGDGVAPGATGARTPEVLTAAPVEPAIEPSFEPPRGFCPKCVAPRAPDSAACPACGLVFANYQPGVLQPSAALAAAWTALAARWGHPAEHARFLALAGAGDELAMAGRLYRVRLAEAPDDRLARSGVEATLKMASAPVAVAAIRKDPTPGQPPSRRRRLVIIALVLLGPTVVSYLLLRFLGGP